MNTEPRAGRSGMQIKVLYKLKCVLLSVPLTATQLYQIVGNTHTWIISDIHMNNDITINRVAYQIYYERVEGICEQVSLV